MFYEDLPNSKRAKITNNGQAIIPMATEMPLTVVERYILATTQVGDLIIDLYSSGTIGIAALKWGRKYIGFCESEHMRIFAEGRMRAATEAIAAKDYSAEVLSTGASL
jgi:DNA modification methylase